MQEWIRFNLAGVYTEILPRVGGLDLGYGQKRGGGGGSSMVSCTCEHSWQLGGGGAMHNIPGTDGTCLISNLRTWVPPYLVPVS